MDITKEQINEHIKRLVTKVENEKIEIIRCMGKFDKTCNPKYSHKVIIAKNRAQRHLDNIDRWKKIISDKENEK